MDFFDVTDMVAGGESEHVEFKATTGERKEAARTLSAMLNGRGGSVLFGVSPKEQIVGQQVGDRTLLDLTGVCKDSIYPPYPPSIERVPLPGNGIREVLVATVPSGNMKPYAYRGDY